MRILKVLLLLGFVMSLTGCVKCTRERTSLTLTYEAAPEIEKTRTEYVTVEVSDLLIEEGIEVSVDLGTVREGDKIEKMLIISNSGDKPLVILQDRKSCNCVKAAYSRKPIPPGGNSELKIDFDSKGFSGMVNKPIRFTTNLSDKEFSVVVVADVK